MAALLAAVGQGNRQDALFDRRRRPLAVQPHADLIGRDAGGERHSNSLRPLVNWKTARPAGRRRSTRSAPTPARRSPRPRLPTACPDRLAATAWRRSVPGCARRTAAREPRRRPSMAPDGVRAKARRRVNEELVAGEFPLGGQNQGDGQCGPFRGDRLFQRHPIAGRQPAKPDRRLRQGHPHADRAGRIVGVLGQGDRGNPTSCANNSNRFEPAKLRGTSSSR